MLYSTHFSPESHLRESMKGLDGMDVNSKRSYFTLMWKSHFREYVPVLLFMYVRVDQ